MSFLLLLVTAVLLVALPPGGLTTDPDPRLWFPTPYPLGWPYPSHGQGPYPYFSPYLYHGAIDSIQLLTNQLKEQSSQLQSLQEKMKLLESKLEKFTSDEKTSYNSHNCCKHLTEELKTIQTQVENNSQDVKVLNSTQVTQRSQLEQQGRGQEGQERRLQEQMKKLQDNSRMIQSMNNSLTCENINLSRLPREFVYLVTSNWTQPIKNVALKKPSAQSSMNYTSFLPAELAVDGIKNTDEEFCQHTSGCDSTVWWMVDLQGFFHVVSVEITNRGDYVGYRLKDFDVEIHVVNPIENSETKHICYHHSGSMDSASTKDFKCSKAIVGRFVRISMPGVGEPMHLCEVEVMGKTSSAMFLVFELQPKSRAVGKILGELIVNNATECVDECAEDTTCNAVNVGQKTPTCAGRQGVICQKLSYGGLQEPGSLFSSDDWSFYQIMHVH